MSEIHKREIVYLVTAVVVGIMFAEYFFVEGSWGVAEDIRTWATIIANIALGLGAIRLLQSHVNIIQRRRSTWAYSTMLIALFAIVLLSGLVGYIQTEVATSNPLYSWVFEHPYTSLGQTLYAITGFYIFSAAYRAFRARNLDAALLLISGCLVMLTNAPVGEVIWSGFPVIGRWLLDQGQIPGMRSFLIVAAFGMLAYGFRALLGKEKGFYGEVAG